MSRAGHRSLWQFRGLALHFGGLVLVISLLSSGVLTWVSVRSIEDFVEARIDRRFPETLTNVRERVDLWYRQHEIDVQTFARRDLLVEAAGQAGSRAETERYLGYVLERFPQYAALVVLDGDGERWLGVGDTSLLPESASRLLAAEGATSVSAPVEVAGHSVQIVSAPIEGRASSTLQGVLRLDALESVLRADHAEGAPARALLDASGQLVAGTSDLVGIPIPTDKPGEPLLLDRQDGERFVASAMPFGRFDWTLAVHEPYDAAYAPVNQAVTEALGINLLVVLTAGLLAYAVGAWRARPILALAEGAERLAEGETGVVVPVSRMADEMQVLARAFNHMIGRLAENRLELETRNLELQAANEVLEQLSITDGLTKLHNHRYFQDQFLREARRAKRAEVPLSLVLIDIDDFKKLNDELGHAAGDVVLKETAAVMTVVLRETDMLARYGGEEFALLAPDTKLEGAMVLAEKIRATVAAAEFPVSRPDGTPVSITVSLGVAPFDGDTRSTFEAADRALYEAKQSGKDCVRSGGEAPA